MFKDPNTLISIKKGKIIDDLIKEYVGQFCFPHSNLQDLRLVEAMYLECNFFGTNFSRSILTRTSFVGSTLKGAIFRGANLTNVDFTNADLTDVVFEKCILDGANFYNAKTSGANFLHVVSARQAIFERTDLCGCTLSGACFTGATFFKANLTDAICIGTNFTNVDLSHCTITGIDFTRATLVKTNLSFHNEQDLNFTQANMSGAIMDTVTLRNCNFTEAKLYKAHFSDCFIYDPIKMKCITETVFDNTLITNLDNSLEYYGSVVLGSTRVVNQIEEEYEWVDKNYSQIPSHQ